MATHSTILAWKIPWAEEPGRLYSPWSHKESDTTEQLHVQGISIPKCCFWPGYLIAHKHNAEDCETFLCAINI